MELALGLTLQSLKANFTSKILELKLAKQSAYRCNRMEVLLYSLVFAVYNS